MVSRNDNAKVYTIHCTKTRPYIIMNFLRKALSCKKILVQKKKGREQVIRYECL